MPRATFYTCKYVGTFSSKMLDQISVIPAAGKHAIEVMALAVEWDRPFSAEALEAARGIYDGSERMREFLPRTDPIRGVTVHLGIEGPAVSTA